jgi:hypothetical protein
MITEQTKYERPARPEVVSGKEDKVDPMWSAEEDDRRMAFARRAAAGARKALSSK